MKESRKTEARKAPSQKRSQQMVEKIQQAARDLLIREGLEALTTSKVASVAGISVGSLYQYFPNKLAIIQTLYQLWLDSVIQDLEGLNRLNVSDTTDIWPSVESWLDEFYSSEHYQRDSDTRRLENELSKGMKLYKELKEIDTAHQWQVAGLLAGILRKLAPDEDSDTLKQAGLYLYYLNESFESLSGEADADIGILLTLHKQSMMAVVKKLVS